MNLGDAEVGQVLEIISFPEGDVKSQGIRFGIDSGEFVIISQVYKKGPVVIKKGNQEIAIGRKLAEKIVVRKGR